MATVLLELPEGFESSVSMTGAELARNVRVMAALKMFELGKLSSGRAAELAGVTRLDFYELCAQYGVPVVDYAPEELDAEMAVLEQWTSKP